MAGKISIQNGEKVAFLGDSITRRGWANPWGYIRLVIAGLEAVGISIVPIPAGVGGSQSDDMLARLEQDVLSHQPAWMVLSCGVNDVWHGERGVPLESYQQNIISMVRMSEEKGIKIMILTATVIGENLENPNNQKLASYNDFLRGLAREKDRLLADVNADMQRILREHPEPGVVLTLDGVHLNPYGDRVLAVSVLKAFGLDEEQLRQARERWQMLNLAAG